tara:strand:+ start:1126 stop:1380 length:255 start_codon:yes stop_codon:yes gene_type:complete
MKTKELAEDNNLLADSSAGDDQSAVEYEEFAKHHFKIALGQLLDASDFKESDKLAEYLMRTAAQCWVENEAKKRTIVSDTGLPF